MKSKSMKTLYKTANRIARVLRLRRLESWSYLRWFGWWMRKDPVMGYWRFSAEYLRTGGSGRIIRPQGGKRND